MMPPGATVPFGPLWFLGVYLVVVAVAPLMIRLHERFRWWVPAAMVAGAIAADAIGFMGGLRRCAGATSRSSCSSRTSWGSSYARRHVARLPRARVLGRWWPVGLGGLLLLTNPPIWSPFGARAVRVVPGHRPLPEEPARHRRRARLERVPADALLPAGGDLDDRRGDAAATGSAVAAAPATVEGSRSCVNGVIMTLFLWHMTAFLLAMLLLWPLGLGHQHDTTPRGGSNGSCGSRRPALILVGLVAIFARRFERPRRLTGSDDATVARRERRRATRRRPR